MTGKPVIFRRFDNVLAHNNGQFMILPRDLQGLGNGLIPNAVRVVAFAGGRDQPGHGGQSLEWKIRA